jgi:hypothetical protein
LNTRTYSVDEIFQDIEGDEENCLMTFPPEVVEDLGWSVPMRISIEIVNDQMIITPIGENDE